MPAVVNRQEPSKLKEVLLAPVRWLIMSLLILLIIVLLISCLAIYCLIIKPLLSLHKLYLLVGGKAPEWVEQRAEAFEEMIRTPQTTHDTDVNDAISINVQKLRENYGEPDVADGFHSGNG